MHPYIPHITETLHNHITGGKILATATWPKINFDRNENIEKQTEFLFKIVRAIRNLRAENNIKPGDNRDVYIV